MKTLRTLHNLNEVPPGGFRYFCPHNGRWSEPFTCVRDMMTHLRKFYYANNWSDAPSEEEILDTLCRLLEMNGSGGCCTGDVQYKVKNGKIKASIKTIAQGTKVYADWIRSTQIESLTEAERRAAICVQCPWNVESNECKGCGGLSRFAQMVGNFAKSFGGIPATSQDKKLHTCSACLCALKIKVFCPLDIIQNNLTVEQKAKLWEQCWIK